MEWGWEVIKGFAFQLEKEVVHTEVGNSPQSSQ